MSRKYKANGFDTALSDALEGYSEQTARKMKDAVDRVAAEADAVIRRNIRFRERTGNYAKNFRTKTVYEDAVNKRNRWYVDKGYHRLTHLLENGHRIVDRNRRSHGMSRAFPHIRYGAEYAQKALPEEIAKAIKEG